MISKVELWGMNLLWASEYMMLMMLGCYGDRFLVSLFKKYWSFLALSMLLHSLDGAIICFVPLQ